MEYISIYETQAMTARITADGKTAAVTFQPHGSSPVSIQLSREALQRFVRQAKRELEQAAPADKA
jgi:hypothetical protein